MHLLRTLGHFRAVMDGLEAGEVIDYERRPSGPAVEPGVGTVAEEVRALRDQIAAFSPEMLRSPVTIRIRLSSNGPHAELPSTLARELVFATRLAEHNGAR